MLPKALALVSTVLLLMSLGFFVLGATPLLILKHEVAMDSKVIRQVFHYCYRLVAVMAAVGSIGYAAHSQPVLSLCLGSIALLAVVLHHWMMTRMDTLRTTMHEGDRRAISRFRKLHVSGIAMNLMQLGVVGWAMTQIRL
mgnify:FL=1|jgi:hypothetical protein